MVNESVLFPSDRTNLIRFSVVDATAGYSPIDGCWKDTESRVFGNRQANDLSFGNYSLA